MLHFRYEYQVTAGHSGRQFLTNRASRTVGRAFARSRATSDRVGWGRRPDRVGRRRDFWYTLGMEMSTDEDTLAPVGSSVEEREIAAGIADLEAGRVVYAETVFADIRAELTEIRRGVARQ